MGRQAVEGVPAMTELLLARDLEAAWARRAALCQRLRPEQTDCLRIFHGVGEGDPGLTIDRYGSLVLAQSFRASPSPDQVRDLERRVRALLPEVGAFEHVDRSARTAAPPAESPEHECVEFGLRHAIRARHRGLDPWLFLDLRAGRRAIRALATGRSVLNLFAYTCSAGLVAAAAGAREVWNVDFSAGNLEIGRRSAARNGLDPKSLRFLAEDCLAVARQLAGIPVGRWNIRRRYERVTARQFGLVVLDPVAYSRGPFGTVDIVRDYQSLFKPAWLATEPGGVLVATNHSSEVDLDEWLGSCARCAAKAGRPVRSVEVITPDEDFPSFDGRHPLKVGVFGA
jgi:23S rRNA (cytosine1962-C5)-methyltransferase